jgi:hypothetical protein
MRLIDIAGTSFETDGTVDDVARLDADFQLPDLLAVAAGNGAVRLEAQGGWHAVDDDAGILAYIQVVRDAVDAVLVACAVADVGTDADGNRRSGSADADGGRRATAAFWASRSPLVTWSANTTALVMFPPISRGMPIAASTPINTITVISSTIVKPD